MLIRSLVAVLPILTQAAEQRPGSVIDTDHEFDKGSHLEIDDVTADQVQGLVLLGKVWGFLKYHHPRITSGERQWDYDLLRILPRVLDEGDAEGAGAALVEFMDALLPPVDGAPRAEPPADPYLPADLAWIHDRELLGGDLSTRLVAIHDDRHAAGEQFYVGLHPGVGNPLFTHELPYAEFKLPDTGFRILALFRYWNILRYWFPYRDLIGEDWDGVLAEFLPRLIGARDPDRYRLEMMALIARVHDTHANLWSSLEVQPPLGKRHLPVQLRFIEGLPVVVGYSHPDGKRSGLEIGDVLRAMDGVPIESLIHDWRACYAASNEPTRLRDIARNLTRGEQQRCRLLVERSGEKQPLERDVDRLPVAQVDTGTGRTHDLPGETFRLLSPDVAYLKLSSVKSSQTAEYIRAASGTRGLVIDIRNYPSEFVVFTLGGHLITRPTAFARFTQGDLGNPGAFVWTESVELRPLEPTYQGRIAILVDEVSQSQAEYTAMALRVAPGAVVVGSTTAGADGNVSDIPLPGGLRTMISGIGVFYPDKRPTQRVGILADIEARPTISGLREGRDEVLEAALRAILGDEVPQEEIIRMARR